MSNIKESDLSSYACVFIKYQVDPVNFFDALNKIKKSTSVESIALITGTTVAFLHDITKVMKKSKHNRKQLKEQSKYIQLKIDEEKKTANNKKRPRSAVEPNGFTIEVLLDDEETEPKTPAKRTNKPSTNAPIKVEPTRPTVNTNYRLQSAKDLSLDFMRASDFRYIAQANHIQSLHYESNENGYSFEVKYSSSKSK